METRSFEIPVSKKSLVDSQLVKLNKRSAKLNLQQITLAYGKAFVAERDIISQDGKTSRKEVFLVEAVLSGPMSIKFDGWNFAATIQHLSTGENIVRAISELKDIPKEYRDVSHKCDHCGINRYRKDTYLVRHDDGHYVQVGSSCMKDFLGGHSPDNILAQASFLSEMIFFFKGLSDGYEGFNGSSCYHINAFLAQTAACIKDFGWLSKSKAYESGGKSTSTRVLNNLNPPGFNFERSEIEEKDKVLAEEALNWVENLSDSEVDNSDYLFNIRAIARTGLIEDRTAGYGASIISAYTRTLTDKVVKSESKHFGTLKKREVFELTFKKEFAFDSMYGTTFKYFFEDKFGNVALWSSSKRCEFDVNSSYYVKGSVKAHSDYKGRLQTELTRCDVLGKSK